MSNAIVPVEQYAIAQMSPAELQEVFQDNLGEGGGGISLFDLDRVKVPSGGQKIWMVPDLGEEKAEKAIEGVVVFWEDAKDMWIKSADDGGNAAPDCSGRLELIPEMGIKVWVGHGQRWENDQDGPHDCETCPLNKFGSAEKGTGKKCKDTRVLAILRPGDVLPLVLVLPPTSVQPVKKYMMQLLAKGIKYHHCVTRFTLVEAVSKGNQKYSQVAVELVERLEGPQKQQMDAYTREIQPHLKRKAREAQPESGGDAAAGAFAAEDMEEITA